MTRRTPLRSILLAALGVPLALALSNCASTPQGAPSSEVSDANIAAIVVAANSVDADAGKLAQSKSSNPEVRKFAGQMVSDHTAVNQAAVDLVTKLNVAPEENALSRGIQENGDKTRSKLESLDGPAFDKAYVDNEVSYHQTVLSVVDKTLIPNAKNAELKKMLEDVRPAFVSHLEHAKHLQASLGGS